MIDAATTEAIIRVAVAGAIGGLLGGLMATRRAALVGSILMGVIGGIAAAAIFRIVNVDPLLDAGERFSYLYGFGGGLVLGLAVAASNR